MKIIFIIWNLKKFLQTSIQFTENNKFGNSSKFSKKCVRNISKFCILTKFSIIISLGLLENFARVHMQNHPFFSDF